MENREDIFDALTAFGKNPNQQEIPLVLERYLNCVAKNGETIFPWTQLKPLIVGKMEKVIQELKQGLDSENIPSRPNVENVRFDVIHARIIDALHRFNGAPFTIQRLCELLTEPKRHYKRSDKFMRGLEKNVLVVSTVDPFGRKVVCESSNKHLVNGMDMNGAFPPRDSTLTVPLPPVPGWVFTSSAATTSRTQTLPSESVADQRLGSQISTQTPGVVSNGIMSSGLTSSVYTDQGEQLSMQTEEVIEETVVTMETNEVSPVATDAGEALPEAEEDEDMADDRTSTSSSSSSSSEELSTSSDSIDSSIQGSISKNSARSFSGPDGSTNRPWASIAHDCDEKREAESTQSPSSCQTENQEQSENTNKDTACSLPTSTISSSCSNNSDAEPTSLTEESISTSARVEQTGVDSGHPLPGSSLTDTPQDKEVIHSDCHVSPYQNTSVPNNSISTSVPDSLQSSEAPLSDCATGQNQSITPSSNPESQPLSSSSHTDSEHDVGIVSTSDRIRETQPLLVSADPVVSSSSSPSSTSSSTIPFSVCDNVVTESLESAHGSAESLESTHGSAESLESTHGSAESPESTHGSAESLESIHGSAESPESTHGSAESQESTHGSAESQESTHGSAESQESTHGSAESLESIHGSAESPESTHGSAESQESTHGSAESQESTHGSAESLESTHGSAESESVASSEDDGDLEPPRKCLKLSPPEDVVEEGSSFTKTQSGEDSTLAPMDVTTDHVHSSADDLSSPLMGNVAEIQSPNAVDDEEGKHTEEIDTSCENEASEAASDSVKDYTETSPGSVAESKAANVEDEGATADLSPKTNEEDGAEQMNLG